MTTRPDDDGTLAGGDMIARAKSDVKREEVGRTTVRRGNFIPFATILL